MCDIKNLDNTFWKAADKQRSYMDTSEYKHAELVLIFLNYTLEAYDDRYLQQKQNLDNTNIEWYIGDKQDRNLTLNDKDEFSSQKIFYVLEKAR